MRRASAKRAARRVRVATEGGDQHADVKRRHPFSAGSRSFTPARPRRTTRPGTRKRVDDLPDRRGRACRGGLGPLRRPPRRAASSANAPQRAGAARWKAAMSTQVRRACHRSSASLTRREQHPDDRAAARGGGATIRWRGARRRGEGVIRSSARLANRIERRKR
jgi:hypothetical protein